MTWEKYTPKSETGSETEFDPDGWALRLKSLAIGLRKSRRRKHRLRARDEG
jgi:hypothetical protein